MSAAIPIPASKRGVPEKDDGGFGFGLSPYSSSASSFSSLLISPPAEQQPQIHISDLRTVTLLSDPVQCKYSRVWKGEWQGREMALKIPSRSLVGGSVDAEREARMLLRVGRHPHIVRFFGLARDDRPSAKVKMILVLELINGFCLSDVDENTQHSPATRIQWMYEIAKALDHIHSRGIIHNDIKLENIMVEQSSSRAVLLDFGFADQIGSSFKAGSPVYASPEKLSGSGPISTKVDVYAWAVSTWQILELRQPYDWVDSIEQLIDSLSHGERPRFEDQWCRPLRRLLQQCWDTLPSKRPNMSDVVAQLGPIAQRMREEEGLTRHPPAYLEDDPQ
ncbi:MAG: protein kinase [archaeon]|nr:protein kinase [archaeon]